MRSNSICARRAVAHRWFLFAIILVVFLVTAGLTTMTMFLADAAQAGVRATLDQATMSARAVQLATELAPDEAAQGVAAQHLFATAFAGLPVRVDRAVAGGQFPVIPGRPDGRPTSGPAFEPRTFADLPGHAHILAGTWPAAAVAGSIAVAVPADPGSAAGRRVGDTFTIADDNSGTVFRVAALYRPDDPLDPYFLPQVGGASAAPIVVAVGEQDLKLLSSSPSALWTVSPDIPNFSAAPAESLSRALAGLERLAGNYPGVNVHGVQLSGGLPDTMTTIIASLAAVRGVAALPVLLTAGFGVVLIGFLVAMLARNRRQELSVLRARGLGIARLTSWAATESVAVTVPAALVGLWVSWWIRPWVQSPAGRAIAGPIPWWPAVVVICASVIAAIVLTLRESRRGFVPGRASTVGSIIPVVLMLAAGVVSLWRFRHAGSAVLTESGSIRVDPVALPAPALSLLAIGLVGTLLAALAARVTAVAAGRLPGLGSVLPARELSRRWPTFGAAVLLICLAVSGATLTAGYDRTRTSFADASAKLVNASDVGVHLPDFVAETGAETPSGHRGLAAVGSVRQVTDAYLTPITIGNTAGQLVAAPAADLPGLLPAMPGGYDPAAVARSILSPVVGIALPSRVRQITVDISLKAAAAPAALADPGAVPPSTSAFLGVHLVLWIAVPRGGVTPFGSSGLRVPLGAGDPRPPVTQQVSIPVTTVETLGGTPVIVAIDTVLDTQGTDTVDSVHINRIRTDGRDTGSAQSWTQARIQAADDPATLTTGRPGSISWAGSIPAAATPRTVRLMPQEIASAGGAVRAPVRVVVNQLMAEQLGVGVGGSLDFRLDATGGHALATVAAISPVLPGDAAVPRAMADLTAITVQLLSTTTVIPRANEIWIRTTSPGATAGKVREAGGPGWVVTIAGDRTAAALIDPAQTALWMGVGVFMLLVVLAVALMAGNLGRDRRGEIRPLVAAGLTRRQLVALRRRELLWCLIIGTVLGLAVGLIASILTVSGLARSAVVGAPAQLAPVLGFSAGLWPAMAAGGIGVAAVLVWYGRLNSHHWGKAVR
ncbi:hypothetical protein ABIB25_000084 [Nakamurella sp. UYEF19]|uniref:ABC transporter permease n=1 Tax=Nakamurella sp. UYEF19 TaxID=1756392 RepID=UPI0033981DD7